MCSPAHPRHGSALCPRLEASLRHGVVNGAVVVVVVIVIVIVGRREDHLRHALICGGGQRPLVRNRGGTGRRRGAGVGRRRMVAPVVQLHPRMQQQVLGGDALGRIAAQQRADHAARFGREALGDLELAA